MLNMEQLIYCPLCAWRMCTAAGRGAHANQATKTEIFRYIFQATHAAILSPKLIHFVFCLLIFAWLLGGDSAKVWRRLFVRFIAIDTASHREPIPKYLNNVRFGDIRYAKAARSSELRVTAVEPNIAAKLSIGRCVLVRCATIGGIAAKHDAEQFEFIVAHARQSEFVIVESFVVGKYARIRYSTTIPAFNNTIVDHVVCQPQFAAAHESTSTEYLRYSSRCCHSASQIETEERAATWVIVGTGNAGQTAERSNWRHHKVTYTREHPANIWILIQITFPFFQIAGLRFAALAHQREAWTGVNGY